MSSQSAFTSALFLLAAFSEELLESLGLLVAPEKKILQEKSTISATSSLQHAYESLTNYLVYYSLVLLLGC